MTRFNYIMIAGMLSLLGCSLIDDYSRKMNSRKFMEQAANSNLYEISLSNLALQKATNGEIKAFAELIISDHTKANNELTSIASRKEIPLPDTMDVNKQSAYLSISQDPPQVFDQKFINEMVTLHNTDLAKYDSASRYLDDGEVKEWAGRQIPIIKDHLERAKQLNDLINNL